MTFHPVHESSPAGAFPFFTTPLVIEARRLDMPQAPPAELVGVGAAFTSLMAEVRKVAPFNLDVVLTGETGTGKTSIARAIHKLSTRAGKPFVELNCANIAPELVESELFGHERGAFSGAVSQKKGLMEVADGGTIFLDEIGDMSAAMQVKLLKALEDRKFRRVGGTADIQTDVRVISATHRDLEQMISAGEFRQDLRARLGSFRLRIPALRERPEDVPALLAHYLSTFAPLFGRLDSYTVEAGALEVLASCAWPDNIRQLRSLAERLAFDALEGGRVTAADAQRVAESLGARPRESSAALAPLAPPDALDAPSSFSLSPGTMGELVTQIKRAGSLEKFEAKLFLALSASLLEQTGHHNEVAKAFCLSPRALYKRLRRARPRAD